MTQSARSLEVRIPISPRTDYFNRVLFIARSVKSFYPNATFRISVGEDCEPFDVAARFPWSRDLEVTWHWVERADFVEWRGTAHPYIATIMERYKAPFSSDYVLMIDADVIAINPFDELFDKPLGLSGVIAHVSPFPSEHRSKWEHLFSAYNVPQPRFQFEHTGWRSMFTTESARMTPCYMNTGVLFGPREVFERLEKPYFDALAFVRSEMDSYFFEQIALTLGAERAAIPMNVLPLTFNFPNQLEFDRTHPAELNDIRLLHFLRTNILHRDLDFKNFNSIARLIARRDLAGSNEVLRRRLAELPFSPVELCDDLGTIV